MRDVFELHQRDHAKVSVLDAGFVLGDGVWEGMRLHKGVVLFAKQHLRRLWEGAAALDMRLGLSREALLRMVYAVCDANGMRDGVHIRLMVTRGLKPTPYQDPRTTIGLPTIVVLAEYKAPPPLRSGLRLATVHVRRGAPDVQARGLCMRMRCCPPVLTWHFLRAGCQPEQPQQAELRHRLHRRRKGGRRRGPHARPSRLRGHLQQHQLLHHPRRRGACNA